MSSLADKEMNPFAVLLSRILGVLGLIYAFSVSSTTGLVWTGIIALLWCVWTLYVISNDDKLNDQVEYKVGVSILSSMLLMGWFWCVIFLFRSLF